jgi:hypothetical protein
LLLEQVPVGLSHQLYGFAGTGGENVSEEIIGLRAKWP